MIGVEWLMAARAAEMKNVSGSYWILSTDETNYPALQDNITTDVAIVGGGLIGLTAAYLLSKEGVNVAVLEADRIVQGTTGHSTAKITSQHDLFYAKLINQVGREQAKQYADANEHAIRFIASLVKEHDIDCDFAWSPAYVYTQQEKYVRQIEEEARAAGELGIQATIEDRLDLPFPVKAALKFEGQARFHPLKYLKSLVKTFPDTCRIYEHTRAVNIEDDDAGHCLVIAENGRTVKAGKVIVASHFPFFDGGGLYFARMYANRSYSLGITIDGDFPDGMYITAELPSRSLRLQPFGNKQLVIVAGEGHKTGQTADTNQHYQNLIDYAHANFKVRDILYRWSTQDYETLDGVPYIGRLTGDHPNIHVATGFKKWGIANGTAAARILTDQILTGHSPWGQVFDPGRFTPVASAFNFVTQNANVAKQLISGKLRPALDRADVPIGEARIIRVEGDKCGAFRDEKGKLHVVDVTCAHMGCELEWNDSERSWDCPCHGSRFTYEGDIVEGPALSPLHHPGQGPNQVEPNVLQ
ncbi:MAG: FAD-dependent oxidoreductase [Solirubrobacterales bacterium]